MSMERFVSLRYLHGRKMGFVSIITILSVIGVILGTFVLICALSVANGFEKEVRDRITGTFAHGRIQQFHNRPIYNGDSLTSIIETHPEVVATSPVIMGKGAVERDDLQEAVMIMAVADSLEANVTDVATRMIDSLERIRYIEEDIFVGLDGNMQAEQVRSEIRPRTLNAIGVHNSALFPYKNGFRAIETEILRDDMSINLSLTTNNIVDYSDSTRPSNVTKMASIVSKFNHADSTNLTEVHTKLFTPYGMNFDEITSVVENSNGDNVEITITQGDYITKVSAIETKIYELLEGKEENEESVQYERELLSSDFISISVVEYDREILKKSEFISDSLPLHSLHQWALDSISPQTSEITTLFKDSTSGIEYTVSSTLRDSEVRSELSFHVEADHNSGISEYTHLIGKYSDGSNAVETEVQNLVGEVAVSVSTTENITLVKNESQNTQKRITVELEQTAFSLDTMYSARGRKLPAIIIGSGMAKKFGVRSGNEVVLMSIASEDGELDPTPKMMRLVVSGVFETGMFEYDQGLVFISIPSGQKMFAMRGAIEGINFRCRDMYDAPVVARELVNMLGNYPFKYNDWQTQNKTLFQFFELQKIIITLFLSIIVLVASFNIMATRIMIIMEKRREIGILMSMGATGFDIMKIFIYNGVVIGLIGTVVGTILGLTLCYAQQRYQFIPLPDGFYFINFMPVQVITKDVLIVFFGTNILTVLVTLYPAISAAKILPADAVRLD